ncbi:SUMF1/EgtB/PvdO family nonheme iron enzyme [Psychrobium sp. 1_MG-2023]|uniref:SUMF1/EgtB/PvdO family nonheme iron enzyme n=1 Tax=Psychrobium sp. 1_MG-2023 TaxID=3062624 RepID=UPI000C333B89|nr:SUMF1/EgtB/PvdO family nonheme iron enzyme [Psychrobium sp. 1_MG-2023]MDP2562577.1 SUMF1/EgtB/PvdO family nonheme iron enzyme [Psychrobium sp. 1_MG-2023]PKF59656.1 hypothetical protein CW748_00140 [Alteromonadales bacterium alter-6D02]
MNSLDEHRAQGGVTTITPQPFAPAATEQADQHFRHKPVVYFIASLLFFGIASLWYLFSAKSVVIKTYPLTSDITITGTPHLALADHLLMLPGQYHLNATSPLHFPLTQTFDVTDEQNQQLSFNFTKLPGHLKLQLTQDITPTVKVDGERVTLNKTTINDISAGKHRLHISSPRYFPLETDINIAGKQQTQTLAVSLTPAWANISVNSSPIGAKVFSGQQLLGITPLSTQLLNGEHTLTIEKQGYQSTQRLITVVAGQDHALAHIPLFKLEGQLIINTQPQGVSVTYGDKYLGVTPLNIAVLPNQTQSLLLFKEGFKQQSHQLSVASGTTLTQQFKLKPLIGKVKFSVTPADATLYVAGKLMGLANQTLPLTAKKQHITIKRDGYVDHNTTLVPNPQRQQVFSISLMTLEQSRWQNIQSIITTASGSALKLFKINESFTMGASRREQGRRANETQRTVILNRAFYLGLKEVTNKEYQQFKRQHSSGHVKGNSLNGPMQPVVNVTWLQAAQYCNWLSQQENLPLVYHIEQEKLVRINKVATGYRLPTEAEWAWAARLQQGKMIKYPWGQSLPPKQNSGNYADISGAPILGSIQARYKDGYIVSAPVGRFAANHHGLFDLGGNVAEWVNDYYQTTFITKETNPMGPITGSHHVIRGASWAHGTRTQLRLSFRDYDNRPRNDVGFRVARYAQ